MKPGRNDPCPCGSGKKYKRCCLAADEAQANSPQERIWRRLRRQFDDGTYAAMMLRFVESAYGVEAIDEAWDEFTLWDDEPFDPGSPHMPVFMPWLFSQWSPDPAEETSVTDVRLHGVPPARALLERKGYTIDPVLREYLASCLDAPFSFYEVLTVERGRGLELRNVFTAGEHRVREQSATHYLEPGDLLFGQVAGARGVELLEIAGPVVIPPVHKIELIELRQKIAEGSDATPQDRLREYAGELREMYFDLANRLLHPQMPELQNTDGDKLAPQTLVFDVGSVRAAFDALKSLDFQATDDADHELERAPDGSLVRAHVAWKKPGNNEHRDWDNTVLGHIRIDGTSMRAEVNSNERAEALRRIVEERLGDKARYRTSDVQPIDKLLEDALGNHARRESEEDRALRESPEAKAAVAEQIASHYDHWIEDAIPVLDGRTPLETMRDPDGPEIVEALVRDAERHSTRMGVDPGVFRRMRERLGLPVAE
ncbi:MAG: YecA family protein [Rhodanobacteraceae bacterium]